MRIIPAVTLFTRTFGAHSSAAVVVELVNPALAAPYAAAVGDGHVWLITRGPLCAPAYGCCAAIVMLPCLSSSESRHQVAKAMGHVWTAPGWQELLLT